MRTVIQDEMVIEFDCEAVMRDGTVIRNDVYRPHAEGRYPCITTYGPYGKGMHFPQGCSLFWRDIKEKYPRDSRGHQRKVHELGNRRSREVGSRGLRHRED